MDRKTIFTNLLDVDHSGKVDAQDAIEAFSKIDETVKPHGWAWTIMLLIAGFGIGYVIGRFIA